MTDATCMDIISLAIGKILIMIDISRDDTQDGYIYSKRVPGFDVLASQKL